MVVLLVGLHQHVVVESLDDQKHNLHEVEEAQVLLGLVVGQQDELHNVLQVVLVRNLLDVLQVGQDLHEFVPDRVCEVPGVLDVVDLQKLVGHVPVYLFKVFGHQQLNDQHVFLHVPRSSLLLLVQGEVLFGSSNEPLRESLDPGFDPLRIKLVGNGVVANDNVDDDDG